MSHSGQDQVFLIILRCWRRRENFFGSFFEKFVIENEVFCKEFRLTVYFETWKSICGLIPGTSPQIDPRTKHIFHFLDPKICPRAQIRARIEEGHMGLCLLGICIFETCVTLEILKIVYVKWWFRFFFVILCTTMYFHVIKSSIFKKLGESLLNHLNFS